MKQHKYDDQTFFTAYQQMPRSIKGLEAAGEWYVLKQLFPNLSNKRVLDLGCGFGWHCRFMREEGASSVVGVDLSKKMLEKAKEQTDDQAITYLEMAIEDIDFADSEFDVVMNSLAFHYIRSFEEICQKVYDCLKPGGHFIFSVEHPIFTSRNEQNWHTDEQGNRLHWPIDHYQLEGTRKTSFLTNDVVKYHRTLSTYINDLIHAGFHLTAIREPKPSDEMLAHIPEMKDEIRRPMFLILAAVKETE